MDSQYIYSDLEMEDLFKLGFFRGDNPQQYIFLKINPLINKMLEMKKLPQLEVSELLYEGIMNAKLQSLPSIEEREIINLIRNKSFKRVTVHLEDGKMIQVDTEEELADELKDKNDRELLDIINSHKYQSITIKKQDDKIVRLNRKIPIKMRKK